MIYRRDESILSDSRARFSSAKRRQLLPSPSIDNTSRTIGIDLSISLSRRPLVTFNDGAVIVTLSLRECVCDRKVVCNDNETTTTHCR